MTSVLIVDDEPMICSYLSTRYKREGYQTLTATSGSEALQICNEKTPDVIITDMRMPGGDGKELISEIKININYNPIIVCMTAYPDMSLEDAYEMGIDALFNKPFNIGDILSATKKFLKNKHLNLETNKTIAPFDVHISNNAQTKMIAELSAGIIHNINNHMTFISTSSYLLKKYFDYLYGAAPANDEVKRMINISEKIHKHSLMVSRIIKGIKMLAYPSTYIEDKEKVSVNSIIQNAIDLLEDHLKVNQISYTISCDEQIFISCFPEQILQVFVNLIQNSCDAMIEHNYEEKWIKIEVEKNDDKIKVSFTDRGEGLPEGIKAHIMQPFFTTKHRDKGIGLGLSLSKQIMEFHEGTLEFDETSKNTRFVASFKST